MASELVALHDDNFCKFHVSYACISDVCAVEPRRRFVTERGKKKKAEICFTALLLCKFALITHNAPLSVNRSIPLQYKARK